MDSSSGPQNKERLLNNTSSISLWKFRGSTFVDKHMALILVNKQDGLSVNTMDTAGNSAFNEYEMLD